MNKKGAVITEALLHHLFETLVALMFLGILMSYAANIDERSSYQSNFIANDLALSIDAMSGMEGNTILEYPIIAKVKTEVKKNKLFVEFNKKQKIPARINIPKWITLIENKEEFKEKITVSKLGKVLSIRNVNKSKITTYSCEEPPLVNDWIIDPGHGGTDLGFVNGNLKESELTKLIGKTIKKHIDLKFTRNLENDYLVSLTERKNLASKHHGVISIHIGKWGKQKNKGAQVGAIYYRFEDKESKKYACNIANSLLTRVTGLKGVGLIPIQESMISKEDPKSIIFSNDIGIYMELGNIEGAKIINMKEIGTAIAEVLQ